MKEKVYIPIEIESIQNNDEIGKKMKKITLLERFCK